MHIDSLTLLVAARWIHFASLSVVVGSAVFLLSVSEDRRFPWRAAPSRALSAVAIVAALSGMAWLGGTIANVAGPEALVDPALLHVFFFETPFGTPSALRVALFAALPVVSILPLRTRAKLAAMLVVGSTLLVSQAWIGHAADGGRYATAMILAYAIHVLAAAAWAGSLPALAFAAWRSRGDAANARAMLLRYSPLAVLCVLLIVSSGTANTLFHASSARALLVSTWGRVLGVKLVLFVTMLALAAHVHWRLVPASRRHSLKGQTDLAAISITVEALLALLVFAAAALLGLTAPPR